MRVLLLLVPLALVAAAPAFAYPGEEGAPPRLEISLGAGIATASEESIFNLPSDAKSDPEVLVDFRIRQNLTETFALGFHLYGTTEQTPRYVITDASGTFSTDFDLTIFHVGADVRYRFSDGTVQPYVELGASYVSGTVEGDDGARLRVSGGSIGGGPGFQVLMSRHFAVGLQGLFTAGTAKWEKVPFLDSAGRSYEPGFAGFEGYFTWRWWRR